MKTSELQQQRRWVLWKLEVVNGKETKVPYQPSGRKAMANNPATWNTYAECMAVVSKFSGVGLALGDGVFGVDIDKCCDAVTGKFTPESREIVIGLDSYGEYSPSGTGCHVFGLGDLPGDGKPIVRPIPGAKQIEIKGRGYYFTFTARHLHKTPLDLMPRQDQLTALCQRVLSVAQPKPGMVIAGNEEEKFRKLMAGDLSDYNGDHSRADLALCGILAHRFNNDIYKIDDAFRESPLYRESGNAQTIALPRFLRRSRVSRSLTRKRKYQSRMTDPRNTLWTHCQKDTKVGFQRVGFSNRGLFRLRQDVLDDNATRKSA